MNVTSTTAVSFQLLLQHQKLCQVMIGKAQSANETFRNFCEAIVRTLVSCSQTAFFLLYGVRQFCCPHTKEKSDLAMRD